MNQLVYVMANLKLKDKKPSKPSAFAFDETPSDDEWITEVSDLETLSDDEDGMEVDQSLPIVEPVVE